MHELGEEKEVLESDPDKLEVIFREMVQMCLWGNATVADIAARAAAIMLTSA
jgi:hypothetical protein